MKHSPWLIAACLTLAAAGAARAQPDTREGIALQNQILDLRRQVQDLQSQRGGGSSLGGSRSAPPPAQGGAPNDLTAQLLERVIVLEDAVRALRGRQDELANAEQRHYDELNKQIGDLAFKLQPGAAPTGGPPPLSSPQPGSLGSLPVQSGGPPLTPLAGPVRRTPEVALADANAALQRRDYASAEAAAREVLANNRTSPRAYDAQFMLAQALAGKRDAPQAAIAFDDTYNRNRTGNHAPDALVGLAQSLAAINERKAACDTLGKLQSEFPKMRPDLRAVADGERQRDGCR